MSSNVLFRHQEIGAFWLAATTHGLLADEQGLGKTATAITAMDMLALQRVLVLAPAVVVYNWKREIATWSPSRRVQVITKGTGDIWADVDVVITTHDLLRSQLHGKLCSQKWDLVVVDEAHNFRNRTAARTRRLFGLSVHPTVPAIVRSASRCWLLTGTPMPNNPTELWAYLAGIAPQRLPEIGGKPMAWHAFRSRFCTLAQVPYGDGVKITGARNTEDLQQRLRGFMLRRKKADHLQLPPVRWGRIELTGSLGPELRKFEARFAHLKSLGDRLDAMRKDSEWSTWRRLCGEAKVGAAADLLIDELLEEPQKKLVVFAHHTSVIGELSDRLTETRIGHVRITGDTPPAARTRAVEAFQTAPECRVAICNIVAGGVGITLHAAHDAVFIERSYVPGEVEQAAARIHRIGQNESVLVRVLTLAGSVDAHNDDALNLKREMISEVIK
jgi:SNF2 family DNA or RNA helicase